MNPKWMVSFTVIDANPNERIEVYESSVKFEGIHFLQEEGKTGLYIEAHYSMTQNVTIENCEVELQKQTTSIMEAFLFTLESYHFVIKNSKFILKGIATKILHQVAFGRVCDMPEIKNTLEFYNNTVIKTDENLQSDGIVLYLHSPNNGTIVGNKFYNMGGTNNALFRFHTISLRNCAVPGQSTILVKDNYVSGHPELVSEATALFHLENRDYVDSHGEQVIQIVDNVFENFKLKGEVIRIIHNGKPFKQFLLQGNKFENFYFSNPSLSFINSMTSIQIKDTVFSNMQLDFFATMTLGLELENVIFQNFKGSLNKQQSFIELNQAEIFSIKNVKFEDFEQNNQFLINLEKVEKVQLEALTLENLSLPTDIISLSESYNFSLSGLEINKVEKNSEDLQSFYFLSHRSFLIKDRDFRIKVQQINMQKSSLGLLILGQVFSEPSESQPELEIEISDLKVSESALKLENTFGFVYLPPFIAENLELSIVNSEIDFSSSDQPFLIANSNSKIRIDQFQIKNFNKQILLLKPAQLSDEVPALQTIITGLNVKGSLLEVNSLIEGFRNTKLKMQNSSFKDITSLNRGSVLSLDSNYPQFAYEIKNSSFENCNSIKGGVVVAITGSRVQFLGTSFKNNFAVQGSIGYVTDQGSVSFKNSNFVENYATQGIILYAINAQSKNRIENCTFGINQPVQGKAFESQFQQELNENEIYNQKSSLKVYFLSYRSQIEVFDDIVIEDCDIFIFASAQSQISFQNSKLSNSKLNNLISISESVLNIQNLQLNVIQMKEQDQFLIKSKAFTKVDINSISFEDFQGSFINTEQGNLAIKQLTLMTKKGQISLKPFINSFNSQFRLNQSRIEGYFSQTHEVIFAFNSDININDLTVEQSQNTLLNLQESRFVGKNLKFQSFKSSKFEKMQAAIEGQLSNIEIKSSSFQNFEGFSGIKDVNSENKKLKTSFKVTESDFINIKAQQGSAIQVQNSNLQVENCVFKGNEAREEGGALILSCSVEYSENCEFEITRSIFKQNKAKKGGAISYDLFGPKLDLTAFEDNWAFLGYGNDIASYPMRMQLKSSPEILGSGEKSSDNFEIEVRDSEGELYKVKSENQMFATSTDIQVSVLGTKQAKGINGIFTFDDLYFLGQPQGEGKINFESSLINPRVYEKVTGEILEPLQFIFTFRECRKGEILKDGRCEECHKNTFQLFEGEQKCLFCPKNFNCAGSSYLSLQKGFWRSNEYSTEAIQCLNPEACPGGQKIQCAEGYQGILCAQCQGETEKGFFAKASGFSCQVCEEKSIIILKLLGVATMVLVYLALLVFIIIQSSSRNQYSSVLLRIFTNYLQVTLIIKNMQIFWPQRIENFLSALSVTQTIQQDIFQFGCLFKGTTSSQFALSLIILCLTPVFISLLGFIFWQILSFISPSRFRRTLNRNFTLTTLASAYLSFPIINSFIYQSFNCKNIDGRSYFIEDFSMECYGKEHIIVIVFVVLPAIALWSIGFPLLTLMFMRKNLKNLDQKDTIIKYGLFYIGLRDETYYWEVIVSNYRKMAIVIIAASVKDSSSFFQLLLVFTVLYANHLALRKYKPYSEEWLNKIDQHASAASVSAVILGLLYVEESEASKSFQLELVFYTLVLVNITFIIRWAFNMGLIYVNKVRQKVEKKGNKKELKEAPLAQGYHYDRFQRINEVKKREIQQQQREQMMSFALKQVQKKQSIFALKVPDMQELLKEQNHNYVKPPRKYQQIKGFN